MSKLVVIGNGFDIYHTLDTSYKSFGAYLKKNKSDIYDNLTGVYGFPDIDDENTFNIWADFENSLSLLDGETLFESLSDFLAVPGSPEFRDRDWNSFAIEIQLFSEKMTSDLFQALKNFISEIKYPPVCELSNITLNLDKDAEYLSFNYTDTLERYYGIPLNEINFIHGQTCDNEDLIIGHGVDPENFAQKEAEPPQGLSEEEMEWWIDERNNSYDHSYELGKQELYSHYRHSFKDTNSILKSNSSFFDNLSNVTEVVVLGHSLSEVDQAYFERIQRSVAPGCCWFVSGYGEKEKISHRCTLINLGIDAKKMHIKDMEGFR